MIRPAHVADALTGSALAARRPERQATPRAPLPFPLIEYPPEPLPTPTQLLLSAGFPSKYTRPPYGADDALGHWPAEEQVRQILDDLPRLIAEGAWVYLLGPVGVGKTGVMVRMMHRLPLHRCPLPGPEWVEPSMVRYRLGSLLAKDMLSGDMDQYGTARVMMVDDLDRMAELGGYERDRALERWDTYTETRDGVGLTVVSANQTEEGLAAVPQFARGLDRARAGGMVLTIPGGSRRGRE